MRSAALPRFSSKIGILFSCKSLTPFAWVQGVIIGTIMNWDTEIYLLILTRQRSLKIQEEELGAIAGLLPFCLISWGDRLAHLRQIRGI